MQLRIIIYNFMISIFKHNPLPHPHSFNTDCIMYNRISNTSSVRIKMQ